MRDRDLRHDDSEAAVSVRIMMATRMVWMRIVMELGLGA